MKFRREFKTIESDVMYISITPWLRVTSLILELDLNPTRLINIEHETLLTSFITLSGIYGKKIPKALH